MTGPLKTGLPTDEEVARYRADGALCLRGAFDIEWIERLREAVDADMAMPSAPWSGSTRRRVRPASSSSISSSGSAMSAARDFVYRSPAREIAARLIGSREVVYYHDHLLVKEAGHAPEAHAWHHDQPCYPIDGEQIVSLWLPLDPVDRADLRGVREGLASLGPGGSSRKFFRQGGVDLAVADPRFEPLPDLDAERRAPRVPRLGHGAGRCHRLPCARRCTARRQPRRPRAGAGPAATRWCGDDAALRRARRPDLAAARRPRPSNPATSSNVRCCATSARLRPGRPRRRRSGAPAPCRPLPRQTALAGRSVTGR